MMKRLAAIILSFLFVLGAGPMAAQDEDFPPLFAWMPVLDGIYVQYMLSELGDMQSEQLAYVEAICGPGAVRGYRQNTVVPMGISKANIWRRNDDAFDSFLRVAAQIERELSPVKTPAVAAQTNPLLTFGLADAERLADALGGVDQNLAPNLAPPLNASVLAQVYEGSGLPRLPETGNLSGLFMPATVSSGSKPIADAETGADILPVPGIVCGAPNVPIFWIPPNPAQSPLPPADGLSEYRIGNTPVFPGSAPKDGFFFVPEYARTDSEVGVDGAAGGQTPANQFPVLLIPGHLAPLLPQCEPELKALGTARDELTILWDYMAEIIRTRREAVRLVANQVRNTRSQLAVLRQEQSELDAMDASGSTPQRLAIARAQGNLDILDAENRLRKLEAKLAAEKIRLANRFLPEDPYRESLKTRTEAVNVAIKTLENCLAGNTAPTPQGDTTDARPPAVPPAPLSDLPDSSPVVSDIADLLQPRAAYEATMTLNGFVTRVYQDGEKARHVPVENPNLVSIIRPDLGLIWTMFIDLGSYTEVAAPPAVKPYEMSAELLGVGLLDEVPINKYRITQAGIDGYISEGFYWISSEGITVKSDVSEVRGGEPFNFSIRLTDITIGPQDPDLFELDDGLTEMIFPTSGSFTQP